MYTKDEIARIISALENAVWAQHWDDRHDDVYDTCSDAAKDAAHDAINLILDLTAEEARMLEYSEIAEHPLVWFEDVYTQDVIPALFTQYDGCGAHFAIQVRDKYNDSIVRSTIFIHSETIYGKIWRCWTSRPTDEQRMKTPWKMPKEGEEHGTL